MPGRKHPARPGAHGSVSRETQIELLLEALAGEPDAHTTVSDPARAREVHVADSRSGLEVQDLARAGRIADVGAGAGFPGLVIAIDLPRAQVDLIEAAGRKAAVIDRLIRAAKVENARSVVARAEDWARLPSALGGGREAYDAVTARAVAALPVLVEYAAPLLRLSGVFVAWKGAVAPTNSGWGGGRLMWWGLRSRRCFGSSRFRAPVIGTSTCSARCRPRRSASRAGRGWRRSGRWAAEPRSPGRRSCLVPRIGGQGRTAPSLLPFDDVCRTTPFGTELQAHAPSDRPAP